MVQRPAGAVPAYLSYLTDPAVELSPRWVRVEFGVLFVADSRRALLWRPYGPGRLPTYYFPLEDVRMDRLEAHVEGELQTRPQTPWSRTSGE